MYQHGNVIEIPGFVDSSVRSSARVGCVRHRDNHIGGLLLQSIIKQLTLHMHMVILPVELPSIVVPAHVLLPAAQCKVSPARHRCLVKQSTSGATTPCHMIEYCYMNVKLNHRSLCAGCVDPDIWKCFLSGRITYIWHSLCILESMTGLG